MHSATDSRHIPRSLSLLTEEALRHARSHPQHEIGQATRRKIYDTLVSSPRGAIACKWLAVLSARRVRHIYFRILLASEHAPSISMLRMFDDMVSLAEEFIIGTITPEEHYRAMERGEAEDFYHSTLFAADEAYPAPLWLAVQAAYQAIGESTTSRPLQTLISGEVEDALGQKIVMSSDTWPDAWLAGCGMADDASVDAAYAFAEMTRRKDYDTDKLLEFWEWWLQEAIPRAWAIAEETQHYHRELGFPSSTAHYAPLDPP